MGFAAGFPHKSLFGSKPDLPIDGEMGMRTSRIVSALAAASFAMAGSSAARAQALEDDFWLQVSAYWANVDTDIRVDAVATPGDGTEIDLEDDLGFDDKEVLPSFYGGARLGSGFSIAGEYYSLNRDTVATLDRDIVVQDVTYPTNATLTAGFDTDIYRLTIGWAFVRKPDLEVGVALGLHATDLQFSFEGDGIIGGVPASGERRAEDVLAPLPTVGLFTTFQPMPRLNIGGRLDYLSLSIDDYDGRLINAQAQVSYRVMPNVGIGVMYRHVDYRLDIEKERVFGRFAYEFSGPAVFLEAGF